MIFDALGGLPLGGIPDALAVPVPPAPSSGGDSVGGSRFDDSIFSRQPKKKEVGKELAILLAAYVQYYNDPGE